RRTQDTALDHVAGLHDVRRSPDDHAVDGDAAFVDAALHLRPGCVFEETRDVPVQPQAFAVPGRHLQPDHGFFQLLLSKSHRGLSHSYYASVSFSGEAVRPTAAACTDVPRQGSAP